MTTEQLTTPQGRPADPTTPMPTNAAPLPTAAPPVQGPSASLHDAVPDGATWMATSQAPPMQAPAAAAFSASHHAPTGAYWYGQQGATTGQQGATTGHQPLPSAGAFGQPTAFPPPPPTSNTLGATPSLDPQRPRGDRRRRLTELTVVAVLASTLASGGTYLAAQLGSADTPTSSTASAGSSLGRSTDTAPVVQADPSNPDWTATAAAASPSVVSITAEMSGGTAQGSGDVIDGSGHILTNNHVVAGATSLTVSLADGHTYAATIKGTDPSTDLAVVTITNPPDSLTPIAFGDSSQLQVGEPVMAVGNPLGLAGTVTTGIVSALNRPVVTEAAEGTQGQGRLQQQTSEPVVTNAIQTSAAINPGNSGGALVNAGGQLIGINSSIATLSNGSESGNIGIGFAIPVNEARQIAEQLIATGTAEHAYLGVTPVDGQATMGDSTMSGAQLDSVGSATPAAQAGLKVGDVIIAVDGERVESADSLVGSIRSATKGQVVTLTVIRDGQELEISATLAAKPTVQN